MSGNSNHSEILKNPDFIIIGAQKCGTSTLFGNLRKHPDIHLPNKKQLLFFDENYSNGLEWYLTYFNNKNNPDKPFCTGEASPYYFFHPLAPARIHEVYPDIKLILLLRNPANRAYSQYHHMKRRGRIPLSFEHCIRLEEDVLAKRKDAFYHDALHSDLVYRRFSFLARSRYAEQLTEWLKYFAVNQILIIKSENYFTDTENTFQELFRFLELPPFTMNLTKKHSSSDYPPMKAETREQLVDYFEPYNQQLYSLIGHDFGWK